MRTVKAPVEVTFRLAIGIGAQMHDRSMLSGL